MAFQKFTQNPADYQQHFTLRLLLHHWHWWLAYLEYPPGFKKLYLFWSGSWNRHILCILKSSYDASSFFYPLFRVAKKVLFVF